MTTGVLQERFWYAWDDEGVFCYDAHSHRVTPLESPGNPLEAVEAFVANTLGEPDIPAVDSRSRTRIRNLKLSLSTRCNLDCRYCFRNSAIPEISDPEIAKKAIDAMVNGFGADAPDYSLSYNMTSEPLLHTGLLNELLDYTDRLEENTGKTFFWYVLTNGTVDGESAEKVLTRLLEKTRRLVVSLDGPPEVHDAQRRYPDGRGTHARVMSFVEQHRDAVDEVDVEAVITVDFPNPREIITYLETSGFSKITTSLVRGDWSDSAVPKLEDGYNRLFEDLYLRASKGDFSLFTALRHDNALRPLWKIIPGFKGRQRCFWGLTHLIVDGNGRFYTCDGMIGRSDGSVGTIDTGIDWNAFHQDVSVTARIPCNTCWARYACGGTCYLAGLDSTGDLLSVDPFECRINKHLVGRNLELFGRILRLRNGYMNLRTAFIRN